MMSIIGHRPNKKRDEEQKKRDTFSQRNMKTAVDTKIS